MILYTSYNLHKSFTSWFKSVKCFAIIPFLYIFCNSTRRHGTQNLVTRKFFLSNHRFLVSNYLTVSFVQLSFKVFFNDLIRPWIFNQLLLRVLYLSFSALLPTWQQFTDILDCSKSRLHSVQLRASWNLKAGIVYLAQQRERGKESQSSRGNLIIISIFFTVVWMSRGCTDEPFH